MNKDSIEITFYKASDHQYRKGSFNIKVPKWGNFIIRELSYFQKDKQRWVAFPSRSYEKDGKKKYFSFNGFEDTAMTKSFQEKILEALDKYLANNSQNISQEPTLFDDEPVPF